MLKKIISLLIVFSILLPPETWAMKPRNPGVDEEGHQRQSMKLDPRGKGKEVVLPSSSKRMSTPRRRDEAPRAGDFSLKDMSSLMRIAINADAEGDFLLTQDVHYSHYTEEIEEEENDEHGDSRPENINPQDLTTSSTELFSRKDSSFFLTLRVLPQEGDIESLSNLPPHILTLMEKLKEFENGTPQQQTILRLLERMYDKGNAGKITNRQMIIAVLLGPVIGWGVALGIRNIYGDDLDNDLSHSNSTNAQHYRYSPLGLILEIDFLDIYFKYLIFFDGVCRNIKTVGLLTSFSDNEFFITKQPIASILLKSIKGIFYISSGVVGSLLVYYIAKFYFEYAIQTPSNWSVMCFAGFTFLLDDALFFGSRLSQQFESLFNSYFHPKIPKNDTHLLKWKSEVLEKLKRLRKKVALASPEVSLKLSKIIKSNSILGKNVGDAHLKKAAEVILALQSISDIDQSFAELSVDRHSNKIRKRLITSGSMLTAAIATFGRSVVFWYVMNEIFKKAELENYYLPRIILSTVLGGVIASLVQFKFEGDAVRELVTSILKIRLDDLNPLRSPKRIILGTLQIIQDNIFGILITVPFTITGIFATEGWSLILRLICLVPSSLTTFLGNTMTFHEATEDFKLFLKDLDLTINPNLSSQQKRKLITLSREYGYFIESLKPDLLNNLKLISAISQENEDKDRKFPQASVFDLFFETSKCILDSTKEYDEKARQFLLYANDSLSKNKLPSHQIFIAVTFGAIIGIISSVDSFATVSSNSSGQATTIYFFYSMFKYGLFFMSIDYVSRSIKFISNSLQFKESFYKDCRNFYLKSLCMILRNSGTALCCLLPVYFYLKGLLNGQFDFGSTNPSLFWPLLQFSYHSPFLFLNSLSFFGPVATERLERVLKGVTSYFISKSIPTTTDLKRQRWVKEFGDLRHWFVGLPDSVVHEVYDQVFEPRHTAYKQEEVEQVSVAEALKTLWVMRQFHRQNDLDHWKRNEDHFRKGAATTAGWTLATLARFGSSVIYWYMFSQLFHLIGVENEYATMALSVVLGGIVASLTQGLTEITAGENVAYDLMNGGEVCHDTSQGFVRKSLRRLGKAHNFGLAPLYSALYISCGYQATQDWNPWLRCAVIIPAGLGELIRNKFMLDQSLGSAALFVDRVNAKLTYASATQKRNALVRVADNYKRAFERLHPDVVEDLDKILADINLNPPHAEDVDLDEE